MAALGDPRRAILPRSGIKALQAVPLIECGAAARFGYEARHLALACASHSGASDHVAGVREMLDLAGLDEEALACGAHPPLGAEERAALTRDAKSPRAIHNNCSGKHAAMLACAVHRGLDLRHYERAEDGVQVAIAEVLEDMTGAPHPIEAAVIDGCSVPTWPVPLAGLARAFARLVSGRELAGSRAKACQALVHACMSEPYMAAGRGRFCTSFMRRLAGRVYLKGGAEGVYCGGLPELGVGIALKIDDGAKRAAEAAMAAVLAALLPDGRKDIAAAWDFSLKSWRGAPVGEIAPAGTLVRALGEIPITD